MNRDLTHLQNLAAQARQGERDAVVRLHEQIAPHMVRLVRQALRTGPSSVGLGRHILAELRHVLASDPDQSDGESIARRVAERLCDNLLRQGSPGRVPTRGLMDTALV